MIRIGTIRKFFTDDYQISTEAAAEIAHYLNDQAGIIAKKSVAIIEEENKYRRIQGEDELKRILARHVIEAIQTRQVLISHPRISILEARTW